jgi:hypothetical protein
VPEVGSRFQTLKIAVLSIVLIAFAAGLTVLVTLSKRNEVATDPLTLCPTDQKPQEVLAILVDVSDSFSQAQRIQVFNTIERVRAAMPRYGLLELYTLGDPSAGLVRPRLSICNPGDGANMSELYQNPRLAKARWTKDFGRRVDTLLDVLINQPDSATSPIFEAIQSIALYSFGAASRDAIPHRLLVISDLIQNNPDKFSQYSGPTNFSALRSLPYYSSVRADLSGVQVDLVYLERPSAQQVQGAKHIAFWSEYFADQGAVVEDVTHIFGAK